MREERKMAKQLSNGTAVKVRTVSMYLEDWAEVETLARLKGLNRSSALRVIIREWREMQEPRLARTVGEGNGKS
jgi:hypothetical protein